MQVTWVRFLGVEDPLERKWQPTSVFFPGESHGQRSPADYTFHVITRARYNLVTKPPPKKKKKKKKNHHLEKGKNG